MGNSNMAMALVVFIFFVLLFGWHSVRAFIDKENYVGLFFLWLSGIFFILAIMLLNSKW